MDVIRLQVGQMAANCYLVWDKKTKETIIIDPGDDADFIISSIQKHDLAPRAIVATHGHFDHTMAALELKLAFNIPFYMHEGDEFLMDRIDKTAIHFVGFDPGPPPDIDIYLKNDATLTVGGLNFTVMHTPGHTPGSICLHFKAQKAIFVGDLIFDDGYVGRTDFSYSNKKALLNSVNTVRSLPEDTLVYPGHGEEFLLRGTI